MAAIYASVSNPFSSVSSAGLLSSRRFFYFNLWRTSSSNSPVSKPYHLRYTAAPTNKTSSSFADIPFDLSPPPIDLDLLEDVTTAGGKVSDDGVVQTFFNDDEAMDAFENGAVVVDLSHFGRIKVSGEDRVQFLHNQSTANFECLHEGQGCDTVFVTPTARTIDIAHAWCMRKSILLTVSPLTCEAIYGMLNKYIFMTDRVEIQDITKQTSMLVLVGPKSNQIMTNLNLDGLVGQSYGTHQHYSVNGMPVTVGVGSFISHKGYSIMTSPAAAGSIWKTLCSLGAISIGADAWENLRIFQGRPAPQKELTKEFNVLEAGLWDSISLNKGCYKGQETISRLITYDGVKQNLWGLSLSALVEPGSPITVKGQKVGKVTSCTGGGKEGEHYGLGYIKRGAASGGDRVIVGEKSMGRVRQVPFLAGQPRPTPTPKVVAELEECGEG